MPTSRRGKCATGFSLIELIVVMVLIGLAAALILPSFSGGLLSLELETAARDLVTHMRAIRSEAIAQQEVFRVILVNDAEANGYRLTDAYEKELKKFHLPKGASFVFPESANQFKVSFYPTGRSSGGQFELRTERGKRLTLFVDPITGLASVRRFDGETG